MTIILLALATWRISSLLANETGPYQMFERFRYRIGVRYNEASMAYGQNEFAKLFTCVYCVSIFVFIAAAVLYYFQPGLSFWLSLPLALSAVACLMSEYA